MKVEISNGELVDKVTILQIKLENIDSEYKLENIKKEYDLLLKKMKKISILKESTQYKKLYDINKELWDVEDELRIKEKSKNFDDEFIELARNVYYLNDLRASVKRDINLSTKSKLIEEKEYVNYG